MLRYCVHMKQNLAKDLICLGFCLETIAMRFAITLEDILPLDQLNHSSLEKLVEFAFQRAATSAGQYRIYTHNTRWSDSQKEEQHLANGRIFVHRYHDLFLLGVLTQQCGTVSSTVLNFLRRFAAVRWEAAEALG